MTLYFIFIAIFFIVVIVGLWESTKKQSSLRGVLENQALRRNGEVKRVFIFDLKLQFYIDDKVANVGLRYGGNKSQPTTIIHCKINNPDGLRLTIYKEHFLSKLGKKCGLQEIEVMNPEFDDTFVIKGKDENRIRTFLSSDIQQELLKFKDKRMNLRITHKSFKITVFEVLKDEFELTQFLDIATVCVRKVFQV